MIRVIVKEPGKQAEVREIGEQLGDMQKIVGGPIEMCQYKLRSFVSNTGNEFVLVCNEEGKLERLTPNVNYGADYIAGTLLVAKSGKGDLVGITDNDEAQAVMDQLNEEGKVWSY